MTPSTEHLGYQPTSSQLPPPGADLEFQSAAAEVETLLVVSWARVTSALHCTTHVLELDRLRGAIDGFAYDQATALNWKPSPLPPRILKRPLWQVAGRRWVSSLLSRWLVRRCCFRGPGTCAEDLCWCCSRALETASFEPLYVGLII